MPITETDIIVLLCFIETLTYVPLVIYKLIIPLAIVFVSLTALSTLMVWFIPCMSEKHIHIWLVTISLIRAGTYTFLIFIHDFRNYEFIIRLSIILYMIAEYVMFALLYSGRFRPKNKNRSEQTHDYSSIPTPPTSLAPSAPPTPSAPSRNVNIPITQNCSICFRDMGCSPYVTNLECNCMFHSYCLFKRLFETNMLNCPNCQRRINLFRYSYYPHYQNTTTQGESLHQ